MEKDVGVEARTKLAEVMVEGFARFAASHEWVFAKSMPAIPHYYVARDRCDLVAFTAAVQTIRNLGEARPWGRGKPLIYFDHDGWTYWTMGAPIPITTIINRKVTGTSLAPPPGYYTRD